ncbi:hypothetical protein KDL01_38520 [Actinospica durhamensis]|uniref:Uncharacterized protein n=1 Tax=Actinospica durhamensis TaxID=1508375 RepID=A0A941EXU2_9ACTN|nr:hypothetical protein [Actinospica durhamensis]MBR7839221.1 hypothetical protein [Actinospica durhamensis]
MWGRIFRVLGMAILAAVPVLGLSMAVHGATSYATDQPLSAQFAANDPAVQTVLETVLETDLGKSDTGVWASGFPKMVFDASNAAARGLSSGDKVDVLVWRGGAEGVEIDGSAAYANGSTPLRPITDVALGCFGLFLFCLGGFPAVHIALARLGVSARIRTITDTAIFTFGVACGIYAIGTYTATSLRGGLYANAGVLAVILIGYVWFVVRRWMKQRAADAEYADEIEPQIEDQRPLK